MKNQNIAHRAVDLFLKKNWQVRTIASFLGVDTRAVIAGLKSELGADQYEYIKAQNQELLQGIPGSERGLDVKSVDFVLW